MESKITPIEQALGLIRDGATIAVSGAWMLVPDAVLAKLGERFQNGGRPRDLTAVFLLCPGGTPDQPGIEHLAREGMLRRVVGGSFPNLPESRLRRLIAENRIEAYNVPAGMVACWLRETGARRAGALSRRGLGTFADPRLEGGRMNEAAKADLLSLARLNGEEYLFWPRGEVDVALLRATAADEAGNLSMEGEPATLAAFVMASAARASGGKVIVQVKRVVPVGTLHPHQVKVPGTLVDCVVVEEEALQAGGIRYDGSLCGETRAPLLPAAQAPAVDHWIASRALREVLRGDTVVVGYGVAALVPHLLLEAGRFEEAQFAIEQGSTGGLPLTGFGFGSSRNPAVILDAASQFDLFQGSCFDLGMLSFLQVDGQGRVNVHRLDARPSLSAGIGGFTDIAASARRLVFLGTLTAGGLEVEIRECAVRIVREGRMKKFVSRLDHVSYDPTYGSAERVLYITERAVFRWQGGKVALVELAPGVTAEEDVLPQMEFLPQTVTPAAWGA